MLPLSVMSCRRLVALTKFEIRPTWTHVKRQADSSFFPAAGRALSTQAAMLPGRNAPGQ